MGLRICLMSREYPPETGWGGIATYTYNLSHALAERGHDVHVITMTYGRGRQYSDNGVRIHRIKHRILKSFLDRTAYTLKVCKTAVALLRENAIEIAESPEYLAEGLMLVKTVRSLPVVVKLHTPMFLINESLGWRGSLDAINGVVEGKMEKSLIRSAAKVTSCSKALGQIISLKCAIPFESIKIIPNALNLQKFNENSYGTFRDKYEIGAHMQVVLYLGRLGKIKGVDILLKVIPSILRRFPNTRFVFTGKDCPEAEGGRLYQQYVRKFFPPRFRKKIIFTGHLDEEMKLDAIKASDFLVVPSLWENLPYVCLEAMAYMKPVIGAKVGGMSEVIFNGRNGLLFEPGDHVSLRRQIEFLLRDDESRLRLGQNARRLVEKEFSIEAMVSKTIKVYKEVVDQSI